MIPNLKILFVEDVPSDFELIKYQIKKSGIEFTARLVETREGYVDALLSFKPDIILSDYSLPQFNGIEALEIRQKEAPHTPFILVTGALNEETAVEVMKAGSDDYIIKQNLTRIGTAINSAIEKWEIIKGKKEAEDALIESENILNRTSEIAKVGGWEYDLQTMKPFLTPQTCRIFEVESATLSEPIETIINFYAPQAQPIIRDAIEVAIAHGTPYDIESPFITAKGRHIWVRSVGNAEMKDGKTIKLTGSIQDITERKQSAIALHQSEEKYRAIVENSHDAIYIYKDNSFLFVNDKTCELSGYTKEEFKKMIIWDIVHPEDRNRVEGYGKKRLAHKEAPDTYQARILAKNNGVRNCEFSVRLIPYQNGFAVLGAVRDITERQQAERGLKESEQKFKDLANLLPQVIYELDFSGNLTYVNNHGLKLFEYARDDVEKGMHVMQIIAPQDRERAKDTIRTILSGKEDFGYPEYSGLKKGGSVFPMLSFANAIIKENIPVGLRGVVVDITDRKLTEEALQKSEQQYRRFFEKDISGIYLSTPEGKLLDCNPAFATMLGYSIDEMLELDTKTLYPYLTNRNEFLQKLTTVKSLVDFEVDLIRKDGQLMNCIENVVGIFNQEGELEQFQGYLMDITDRKKAEESLKLSELKYRDLADLSPQSIFEIDLMGTFTYVNKQALKTFGYTVDDFNQGVNISQLIAPEDWVRVLENKQKTLDKKEVGDPEYTALKKDGSRIPILIYASVIVKNEMPVGLRGIAVDITKIKEAEEAHYKTEQKYQFLAKNTHDTLWTTDLKFNLKFINNALFDFLGYKPEEVLGKNKAEWITDEGIRIVKSEARKMLSNFKKGEHIQRKFEIQQIKKDGTIIDTEITGNLLIDTNGDIEGFQGRSIDITNRKQAENAIRESEEKYRSLFETANDAIFVMKDGLFLACNKKTMEIFGCQEDEIVGHSPVVFSPKYQPDGSLSLEMAEIKIKKALLGKPQFFEWVHLRKNGRPFDAEVSLNKMILSDGEYIHAIVRNIDERKIAEKALKENEARLSTLISNLPGMAYLCKNDEQWTMLYVNEACKQLTGYKPEQLINNAEISYNQIIHPEDRFEINKQIEKAERIGKHFEIEYRIITANGEVKWVWERGIHKEADSHDSDIIEGVIHEITERKKAEKLLMESKDQIRNFNVYMDEKFEEEKRRIASEIHDGLGQLLTGLQMDMQWVTKKWPEESEILASKFSSINNILDTTIEEVQKLSFQLRPKMLDELGIVETITSELIQFGERTGIKCKARFVPDNLVLDYNKSLTIYRVLMELLTNIFRHAMATKTNVTLEVKQKKCIFTVADNGVGITQEQITANNSFGLIGINERVNVWKGSVKIQGKPNLGTTVRVTIPLLKTNVNTI